MHVACFRVCSSGFGTTDRCLAKTGMVCDLGLDRVHYHS